ncbi:MAG: phytoene desaturase family protein [Chloroflexi bacterium]|nr:phytoene desaturase family protein [Chloroflexota bacterium]
MQNDRAIVVGGGVGGLSVAIHLALRDYRVSIFESNSRVGGRANILEFDGFKFDTGPSLLNYPWVFDELFQAAGTSLAQELDLIRVDPAIKFYWPDKETFQLSSDLTCLSQECRRLDPRDGVGLFNFLKDARHKYNLSFDRLVTRNADSPLSWFSAAGVTNLTKLGLFRSMDSQLGKHFHSNKIREAFGSYGMYLGGAPYDLPGIFSIIPFGELEHGLWLPKGGMYGLIEAMERVAVRLGVDIRTNSPVGSIDSENDRVVGVNLADGSKESASVVVSNVDVPTTMTRLLGAKSKASSDGYKPPKMTPGVITYYLGLDRELPELNHHSVFLPENPKQAYDQLMNQGKVPDDLPFYVSVASNSDPALAPAGKSGVFLLAPVPLLSQIPGTDWQRVTEQLRSQMFQRMNEQGIAISEKDVVSQKSWSPVDWSDQFGLFDGSAFGAAHNFRQIGPFRPRNISSDISGLFFAGASTTPGTGVPMCVLSGKMAADRISDWARKKQAA